MQRACDQPHQGTKRKTCPGGILPYAILSPRLNIFQWRVLKTGICIPILHTEILHSVLTRRKAKKYLPLYNMQGKMLVSKTQDMMQGNHSFHLGFLLPDSII